MVVLPLIDSEATAPDRRAERGEDDNKHETRTADTRPTRHTVQEFIRSHWNDGLCAAESTGNPLITKCEDRCNHKMWLSRAGMKMICSAATFFGEPMVLEVLAIAVGAAIATPDVQMTPPTYLRCPFRGSDVLITADEANSSVTLTVPSTGHIEKLPAAFSATELRFSNSRVAYTISRTDLTAIRSVPAINATHMAQCVVEVPPKRAF